MLPERISINEKNRPQIVCPHDCPFSVRSQITNYDGTPVFVCKVENTQNNQGDCSYENKNQITN